MGSRFGLRNLVQGVWNLVRGIGRIPGAAWDAGRSKRGIDWISSVVGFQIFLSTFVIVDCMRQLLPDSVPWYVSVAFYAPIMLGFNKVVPNSDRVKVVGDRAPVTWLAVKAALGCSAIILSGVVRCTVVRSSHGPSLWAALVPVLTTAAVLAAFPYAVKNVREDIVKEVLNS